MYRALCTAHSSFCSSRMAPIRRVMASSLGKMPTTLVRRLISPCRRSSGLVEWSLARCAAGEAHTGQHVVLGLVHEDGQLRCLGPELVGDLAPLDPGAVRVLLGEGSGDEGGHDAPALPAGMGQQVAHEVHAAALPCGAEDAGHGGLQTLVVVGDRQLHAAAARAGPASAGTRSRKVSASDAPIATPRTSRRPWSLTATATVTATETMRPASRTFT